MGSRFVNTKVGRRPIHVAERSSPQDKTLTTIIEITGNRDDDMRQAANLRGVTTYDSQLAARGVDQALEYRLPRGRYEVSCKSAGGPIELRRYR